MRLETDRERPATNEALSKPCKTPAKKSRSSLPPAPEAALLTRRPDYGVLVTAERADGAITSQVYRNLGAAERKRNRCHERRLRCELLLVRLVPVGVLPLAPSVPVLDALLVEGGAR